MLSQNFCRAFLKLTLLLLFLLCAICSLAGYFLRDCFAGVLLLTAGGTGMAGAVRGLYLVEKPDIRKL